MKRSAPTLVIACLAALGAAPAPAAAQEQLAHGERPMASVALGVGTLLDLDRRTAGIDHDQPTAGLGLLDSDNTGLAHEGSFTVALGYMHPLLRHFALGAEVQLLAWASRVEHLAGYPRYTALDLSIVPRFQLPVGRRVLLTASLPLGPSLDIIDADLERRGFREEASLGTGWNLALRAGIAVALLEALGVKVELALSQHWFDHTWSYVATKGEPFENAEEEVSYESTTLLLTAGCYYALP